MVCICFIYRFKKAVFCGFSTNSNLYKNKTLSGYLGLNTTLTLKNINVMNHKATTSNTNQQKIPAGLLPNDHNIEFVGNKSSKTVIWIRCGNSHRFETLPETIYTALEELFLSDQEAVQFLTTNYKKESESLKRLVEIYTYYMYGQLDNMPDVMDGQLQPSENYRETSNCPSLQFKNKYIDINGVHLSSRDLSIIDSCVNGLPDKMIASRLGIAHSTYDFHKRNLFKKLGVSHKGELIVESFKNNIPV